MKELLETLKQYILSHPPDNGDGEGILDMLFWHYVENCPMDNERINAQFAALREMLNLPPKDYDVVFYAVSDLCLEHGRLAFGEGLKFGIFLMQELIENRN